MDAAMIVLRSVITVALFGLFVALLLWAFSPGRKKEFRDAANLVFDERDACRREEEKR